MAVISSSSPSSSPVSELDPPYRYTKRFFYDKTVGRSDDIRCFAGVKNAVGVCSITEMATTLIATPTKEAPDMLVLIGHAKPSHQGLGSGNSTEYNKKKDFHKDHLDDLAEEIDVIRSVLKPKGARSPILFLTGCAVAKDPTLVIKLSAKLTNVCVIGCKNRLSANEYEDEEESGVKQVYFQRLENSRPSIFAAQMVYAYNGKALKTAGLKAKTGHSPKELYQELMMHGDEPDLEFGAEPKGLLEAREEKKDVAKATS